MHATDRHGEDVRLIERIVERDAAALSDLYDRHSRLLFSLCLRILRDRSGAEEVLQETFVAVWTRAEKYNAALGLPVAWLVGIARNRAIDRLRATARRPQEVEMAPWQPDTADDPEQRAAFGERRHAVARALDTLPQDHRLLIEQAYFLGLTQSELSERHQLPLGTVKTRIRSGMMLLRQQLQQRYAVQ
ncbi:MAG TPA: sigma-70 family RNA polymerase sigma factor [Vicinamibacterales bacterium]|nr:sigma-70 family RNA polymerase sigma factor [Vicinamibacterales bacterium]